MIEPNNKLHLYLKKRPYVEDYIANNRGVLRKNLP